MAADLLMETSPHQSPETMDSRKRPREFDNDYVDPKRTNVKTSDGIFYFKMLVPSIASGAIIGKGGETIAQLQKETGTKIKMSKSSDFYPGTTERVCLISGSLNAIMNVVDFIMEKIKEKPDVVKIETENSKPQQDRDKQVKILVPNTTAGMIIGKSGNYIKQIKETSGSYVQISQKSNEISLQERCITVIGEKECNKKACLMILEKIALDPSSGSCLNLSYAEMNGPVANFNPTGSPFATSTVNTGSTQTTSFPSFSPNGLKLDLNPAINYGLALNGGLNLNLNIAAPPLQNANHTLTAQILEHIKMIHLSLRSCGYSDLQSNEICSSLSILTKYGLLGFNFGLQAAPSMGLANFLGVALEPAIPNNHTNGVFGSIGQLNIGASSPSHHRAILDRIENTFEQYRPQSTTEAKIKPIHNNNNNSNVINQNLYNNNNSFGLGTSGENVATKGLVNMNNATAVAAAAAAAAANAANLGPACKSTKSVEIPETVVGAILGCYDPTVNTMQCYHKWN